jgi:hypothetical protein
MSCVLMRVEGVGKDDGNTSERSRMSSPWRDGSANIQSQGGWEGVAAAASEPESRAVWLGHVEGGRPLAGLAAAAADAGRISCASLRPVSVEAKMEVEAPEGL